MQLFRNMNTASKIVGLVTLMAVFLALVGITGYYSSNKVAEALDYSYKNRLLPIKWLNASRANTRAVEAMTMEILLSNDRARAQKDVEEIKARVLDVDQLMSNYEKSDMDSYENERFPKLKEELKLFRAARDQAIAMALAGKHEEAYAFFLANGVSHLDAVNEVMKDLAEYNSNESEKERVQSEALVEKTNRMLLGFTVFALLFSLGVGWMIARMIARPLKELVVMAREVAQGDLSVRSGGVASRDEAGQLTQEFRVMTENLRGLVRQVAQTAEQVAASSEELTASAEQSAQATSLVAGTISEVAQGAEEQVTAADRTVSVVEHVSAGITQVAASANTVSGAADRTAEAARQGDKAVDAAMAQMTSIERSVTGSAKVVTKLGERSKEIGQIVDTISGIAGQTNLLALNAAIEAARAGEQGRGFAVVAEEVRKLAEQSQDAAKQIAAMIGEIQAETESAVAAMDQGTREVRTGADVVNNAGRSFKEIVQLVGEVSRQIHEISTAIQQMASGSQEIVRSMREIDRISQGTASQTQTVSAAAEEQSASMQEIAASSQALARLAESLQAELRKFRT